MTAPNFNSNTTGGTLQGIAQLLKGLSSLNDPDAQKRQAILQQLQSNPDLRDQYIEQYQNDPQSLNTLLGKKPLIGGGGSYGSLKSLLTGPLTPEAQARIDTAKATSASAKNSQILSEALTPSLEAGKTFDDYMRTGKGGILQDAPPSEVGDTENNIESIPVVKGPGVSDTDYQRYQESLTKSGILTPDQRAENAARVEEQRAQAARSTAELPGIQAKVKGDLANQADKEQNKIVAQSALARLGNQNLYTAFKAGKISASERNSILDYDKGAKQYDEDQADYFRTQQLEIERDRLAATQKDIAQRKDENAALFLFEKVTDPRVGGQISMDDARRVVKDPKAIMDSTDPKDAPVKEALQKVQDASAKDVKNKISATYSRWVGGLKTRKPTDEDVNNLNNELSTLTPGTGFEPVVYQKQVTKAHTFKRDETQVAPISGDPRILPAGHKIQTPQQDPSLDTFEQAVEKVKSLPKDQMVKKLIEMGWDPETGQKVKK